jgi:hypothetical protein
MIEYIKKLQLQSGFQFVFSFIIIPLGINNKPNKMSPNRSNIKNWDFILKESDGFRTVKTKISKKTIE